MDSTTRIARRGRGVALALLLAGSALATFAAVPPGAAHAQTVPVPVPRADADTFPLWRSQYLLLGRAGGVAEGATRGADSMIDAIRAGDAAGTASARTRSLNATVRFEGQIAQQWGVLEQTAFLPELEPAAAAVRAGLVASGAANARLRQAIEQGEPATVAVPEAEAAEQARWTMRDAVRAACQARDQVCSW